MQVDVQQRPSPSVKVMSVRRSGKPMVSMGNNIGNCSQGLATWQVAAQ